LDKVQQIPLYKQIKNRIVQDIRNQVYKPGGKIPTQEAFAKKYGVSRVTVRQAIVELVQSGVLYTQRGKGTFVRPLPLQYRGFNRLHGFSENVRKAGQRPASKVLRLDVVPADTKLAPPLMVDIGHPLVYVQRLRMVQHVPVTLENVYLNWSWVRDIDFPNELQDDVSLYELLKRRAGITFQYAEETIGAVLAGQEEARRLGVTQQDPILFIRRTTYVDERSPVEYCENYMRSDVHGIVIRYDEREGEDEDAFNTETETAEAVVSRPS